MKKLFASVLAGVLLLAGTQAFAQVIMGVGYLNTQEITKVGDSGKQTTEGLNGLYFGGSYNMELVGGLGFAPGLYLDMLFQEENYSTGGYSLLGLTMGASATARYRELAANVPLNLTFGYDVNGNVKLFAFAGPVFQVGLLAQSTQRGSVRLGNITYNEGEKYDHYNTQNGDMNRFNILLGGGIGIEVGDIQFMIGYDHSLMNFDSGRLGNLNTRRSQIRAGVNFNFGD